jgi:hypothetical protein
MRKSLSRAPTLFMWSVSVSWAEVSQPAFLSATERGEDGNNINIDISLWTKAKDRAPCERDRFGRVRIARDYPSPQTLVILMRPFQVEGLARIVRFHSVNRMSVNSVQLAESVIRRYCSNMPGMEVCPATL